MADFRTLINARTGIPAEAVHVQWHNETPLPPPEAQERMNASWESAVAEAAAQGAKLFDGPITQLLSATANNDDVLEITLHLGPGSYKGFVVTRLRDAAWFEANAPAFLTRALGNSALLTHGTQALVGIRSSRVSCYPGRAHLIGGVLDLLSAPARQNTQGLLAHLLLELNEEAGLSVEDLAPRPAWPRLLGIFEDVALGQPEAIWHWETQTPLAEIARRIDPDEHAGHLILEKQAATEEQLSQLTPLSRVAYHAWSHIPPS